MPAVFKSRLRLKHLELFRHVCELHSLRKAAEASSMTQPAATKLIHELEDMFGVTLFQRDRRGMRSTQHGDLVKRHFQVVMADLGNLCVDLDMFARGGSGTVKLGIVPSLSSVLLSHAINKLLVDHPNVHFEITEGPTNSLMSELLHNNLDLFFGRILNRIQADQLRIKTIYTESFDIVCATSHRLNTLTTVTWHDLAKQRWVLPATGTPLREMAEHMFTAQGMLRPEVSVASSSFHQMRFVVAAGNLIGVLPRTIAQQAESDGDLKCLRPSHRAKFAPISLISRNDVDRPPLIDKFENIVVKAATDLGLG